MMWANERTSADGAGPLRFALVAQRRATAEFYRSASFKPWATST
jgi:hypothetical protein